MEAKLQRRARKKRGYPLYYKQLKAFFFCLGGKKKEPGENGGRLR